MPFPLKENILRFITQGQGDFAALAQEVFAYQFAHNSPYRRLCEQQGITPETLAHWRDIPPVPTTAFKFVTLACEPVEQAQAVFISSGTTHGPATRSRHFMFHLDLYRAAIIHWFAPHLLPDRARLPMLVLMPPPKEMPHSSLAYMMGVVVETFGTAGSGFYFRHGELQVQALIAALEAAVEPVCLLGPSFSFLHFLEACAQRGVRLHLPPGSRLMDTGGFKGRAREVPREELYAALAETLGLGETFCVNEYGMAEMSSQFYDRVAGQPTPRRQQGPPWVRTVIVDPETLREVLPGEVGLLRHYDLANLGSVMALQTEDWGRAVGDGFELLGRAPGAEAKGCSLLIEEMLEAKAPRQLS